MAAREPRPPDDCAQCGAAIPPRAHACPACGADERTGWREQSIYDGLDLPDPDEENASSSSSPRARRPGSLAWYWIVIGLALIVLLALSALGLR